MIAVIFEVVPAPGRTDQYLALAARLRSQLEQIDGFLSIERFRSLSDPDKILSLSFFRDEEAVARWRQRGVASHGAGRGSRRDLSPTTGCGSPKSSATTE